MTPHPRGEAVQGGEGVQQGQGEEAPPGEELKDWRSWTARNAPKSSAWTSAVAIRDVPSSCHRHVKHPMVVPPALPLPIAAARTTSAPRMRTAAGMSSANSRSRAVVRSPAWMMATALP